MRQARSFIRTNITQLAYVVDGVAVACSQICVHLSDSLFDLCLNIIYEYATTNVRPNAVRAVHQLVGCFAAANPEKTLARFLPFCSQAIQLELAHGACSLRTTSSSTPLPSDATLYWNLAILRGLMTSAGAAILKHKDELLSLLSILHEKTLTKRAYAWTGKLLFSVMLNLTHTYVIDSRFVNADEWADPCAIAFLSLSYEKRVIF